MDSAKQSIIYAATFILLGFAVGYITQGIVDFIKFIKRKGKNDE